MSTADVALLGAGKVDEAIDLAPGRQDLPRFGRRIAHLGS